MKIYENIVIGNFLYALGFSIRARMAISHMPAVINLLQQTPADTLLGDLLLEFPGITRLIEFKAQGNRSTKEKARHTKLRQALLQNPELESVSRRIHWYIETATSEKEELIARIVPYLDAFPADKQKQGRLETFIETLTTDVVNGHGSDNRAEEAKYLRWVRLTQGDGKIGSGGLLLIADTHGSLHYAQLLDLSDLRLKHHLWLELHEQRLEREIAHQHEQILERKQEKEYGWEMGQ
ncbi:MULTISPECIES: hypothetical protein [Aeromonas]|uniref:hypothetical protein n=1 Tax=Aeromonas TaxID=642 RepID=UPI00044C7413|nr:MULTISPECIES: hypothetical protein [Aeromonas]EZH81698.1 hypothetical protein AT59_13815 [Aeromonas hydrophila AD9]OSP49368.1 hypothetical protein B7G55_15985 [Aeromonas hydrophila]